MTRYEYRMELLTLSRGRSREDQIVDALNRFGQEGWRLNSVQRSSAFPHGTFLGAMKASLALLLEREIADET